MNKNKLQEQINLDTSERLKSIINHFLSKKIDFFIKDMTIYQDVELSNADNNAIKLEAISIMESKANSIMRRCKAESLHITKLKSEPYTYALKCEIQDFNIDDAAEIAIDNWFVSLEKTDQKKEIVKKAITKFLSERGYVNQ